MSFLVEKGPFGEVVAEIGEFEVQTSSGRVWVEGFTNCPDVWVYWGSGSEFNSHGRIEDVRRFAELLLKACDQAEALEEEQKAKVSE